MLLLGGWNRKNRIGVARFPLERPALSDVVEVGKKGIKFLLGDRIVFVVVASAAIERQSQPSRSCRFDPIDDRLDPPLFGDDATFSVEPVIAIKAACDALG